MTDINFSEGPDKDFLEYIVKNIVETPEAIEIVRSVDEMGVLLTLTVDPEDIGKVVGKSGRTAKAIRSLLKVIGARNKSRVNLRIENNENTL